MKEKLQELRDLIATKHGIKLNDKSVTLIVFEMLEFFSNSLVTKIDATHKIEDARYEDFLIKWEDASQRIVREGLINALEARVKLSQQQIDESFEKFKKLIEGASQELSKPTETPQKKEEKKWKRFGLTQFDLNLLFFLLLCILLALSVYHRL